MILFALSAAACGSSGSPSAPSGAAPIPVPSFRQTSQKINATNNELQLSWDGSAAAYQLVIGSNPGSSNLLSTEVTGTTYTWVSPRSGFSNELSLVVLDVRNVIDALYFHSGPLADQPADANTNPVTSVWADGTVLSVPVSMEAGDTARANAQTFAGQYAALVGGAVTATFSLTSDSMHDKDFRTFPEFTIGIRVQSGYCGGALGCVPLGSGPAPGGPNRSIVTLEQGSGLYLSATAHEMGHAYGFGHVTPPAAGRAEFRFMMSPLGASEQMTDAEKLAITLARAAGLRAGWKRSQALAADLVNPYTGASNLR